jgi:hypothetical protein
MSQHKLFRDLIIGLTFVYKNKLNLDYMRLRFCCVILFICIIQITYAQKNIWEIPQKDGVCFIDNMGKVVIKTKYDYVGDFNCGLAYFRDSLTSGYIDTNGKIIISGNNYCSDFNEGLAAYFDNNKLCFIDITGQKVLFPKFENYILGSDFHGIPHFSEGFASLLIRNNDTSSWYNFIFINKKGERVFDRNFLFADNFKEGLAFVILINGECGYINQKGELVIRVKDHERGFQFSEGYAIILDSIGLSYFIDKNGHVIWNKKYTNAFPFSDGMARVEINGKLGFISSNGDIVIQPVYNYASTYDFSEGLASVSINDPDNPNKHLTYLIDKTGNAISDKFKNNAIIRGFKNGLAYGTQSTGKFDCDKHFYINKSGKMVWQDIFCSKIEE